MEPRVQYVRTADGVSIAFWTLGEGPPLVYLAGGPWSHVDLWQVPECRRWYERLARNRTLVRFDMRGTGLSDRSVADFSLDALVQDVEAVVDRLGLERFTLFGAADAGPVAIAYAVRHPERVSHLILWCTMARWADSAHRHRDWQTLVERGGPEWELMADWCALSALGWSAGEIGRSSAEHLRMSVTPETMQAATAAMMRFDVTDLLSKVGAPALVLHRRDIAWLPIEMATDLASRLPDACLTILDGDSTAPYLGDTEAIAGAIDEFLRDSTAQTAPLRLPPDGLTVRETEVLRLIAGGRTNDEIASALVLSVRTVEQHIRNIYRKIHARGRADATAYTLTRGLL
ncbi:MAG: alpha/beta fold hydrolase [Dehalococcoidia bacterium]